MTLHDDDGGWGRDGMIPTNILYVYRPEGVKERAFVHTVPGASHEGRLFFHEKCTGNRASYKAEHVNYLLTRDENPERIKERIAELIPRLSDRQKQWLAEGISDEALAVVGGIDSQAADILASLREGNPTARFSRGAQSIEIG